MASRVILVTGSNTGIGYVAAHILAAKGHIVHISSRKEHAGKEAEKNLDVKFVQLDVTVEKAEGRLDVLVNNAGITGISGMGMPPQSATSAENITAIRAVFETNFFGLIQTTTAFLPLLRASSTPEAPSVILNVSSGAGSDTFQASPKGILLEFSTYNSSKAALNSYTISLAHVLREEGIKVNAANPGFTTSNLNGNMPGGKTTEEGAAVTVKWSLLDKNAKSGMGYFILFLGFLGEEERGCFPVSRIN
ncbi:hypothetical protein C8J57DRAFT_1430104 [Mycena rebaudengoi]|nr:hypothetical protein C8J57DRAFT_1430104 [Mycena rebaudengoi]